MTSAATVNNFRRRTRRDSPFTEDEGSIISNSWLIKPTLKERLDRFFLLRDSWDNIKGDIIVDADTLSHLLEESNTKYKVVLKNSVRTLERCQEVGLSFRLCVKANIAVVLIKAWKGE